MPEYLDDPSVLTKDKLKSELLAHNVELPSGNPTKDVYVQLYLKNLTAHNKKHVTTTTLDVFSSDDELPPPVVSSKSRSSGRKATRKTDKVRSDEMDVTMLTDVGLRDELLKRGVDVGPIVASTRKLYEKKLQRLLDDGPTQPAKVLVTEIQVNHNGNSESDLYSDKEDDVTAEPEPAPVVERPARSRGKTPITTHTRSSQHHTEPAANTEPARPATPQLAAKPAKPSPPLVQLARVDPATFRPMCNISPIKRQEDHWSLSDQLGSMSSGVSVAQDCGPPDVQLYSRRQQKITSFQATCSPGKTLSCPSTLSKDVLVRQADRMVEKIAARDETLKVEDKDVLLFPCDINSPTGITATCRRPIRGAAPRPIKSSDLWGDEKRLFSPKTTKTTSSLSYTEKCTVNRVSSLPPSTSYISTSASSSRLLSAAPPAGQTPAAQRSMSLWIKLFLLAIVAAFLFLVYQAMETNTLNPFTAPDTQVASSSTA